MCQKCNGTNFSEPDTIEKTVQSCPDPETGDSEPIEEKEVEAKTVVVGEICMNVSNSCTSACFYQNGLCGKSLKSFCASNGWSQAEVDAAPVASAASVTSYYKENPIVLGSCDQNGNEITYQSIVNQYSNAGKGNITITFKDSGTTRYYNAS